MKLIPTGTSLLLGAGSLAFAVTPEEAIIAAMRLAEAPNYSWTAEVVDDARNYTVNGMTADGHTWQRQPMPKNIARRIGRDGDYELEAIFSGKLRYVIQTPAGWTRLDELPESHSDWDNDNEWVLVTAPRLRTPDMAADIWETDPLGLPPAIYVPVLRTNDEEDDNRVYSNYQFALSLPHEELATMVSSHTDFQVEGNTATGTLTDLGARLLLVHDGHEYIRPVMATGRFKWWLTGDSVQKYTIDLAGIVVVDRRSVYVRQKSTTQMSSVGTTAFAIPAEARRRL